MAVGFRGSSAGGGSNTVFDESYFDVPTFERGVIPAADAIIPTTGGDSTSGSNFMANVPMNYQPVTKPVSPLLYEGVDPNFQNVITSQPSYFTTESLTDQDIENYLSDTENFVYNPGTGDFEPAGKYTYPLSQLAPGYSDTQEKFMLGIEPKMTGQQLKDIEANRLNTQKLAFETGGDMDAFTTAYTGFTPDGTFVGNADNPVGPVFDYDGDGSYEPAPGNPAFTPGPSNTGGKQ